MREAFQQINSQFKRTNRVEREQVLCAMIRVNYGTPWAGDIERLKAFLPPSFHASLNFNGLTELIATISPFADEPTEIFLPDEEITLNDFSNILNQENTSTITQIKRESDATPDHTTTVKLTA